MSEATLKTKRAPQNENEGLLAERHDLASVQYISDGARCLQAIADKHDHDFLSYVLRLVVLETEIMTEKCDVIERSSKQRSK